jgi:dTDP-4-dehydrorhamnose 3,5-epimerase
MLFQETKLAGVFTIHIDPKDDERGFFSRSWCQQEFGQHGLISSLAQCSISFNPRKGTLRGLHYQVNPHAEAKVVRSTKGSIYDVVVDLRAQSPTFKEWVGVTL